MPETITRFYTFGFDHAHAVNGFTYDKDIVVKITAPDPRAVMLQWFGQKWSMEYESEEDVDLSYYPRGIKDLTPSQGCPNPYCDGTGWVTAGATGTTGEYRAPVCEVGPHA